MSGITVPTLDQIKGSTVMTKLRCLVQKFIDFAQEVDDKIDEPLEQAQQAVTTANTASATANSASAEAHIASENANNASTAATQAATTVAGYNTRLTEAEDGVAENKANILTHDGEITTLQGRVNQLDGDITDITNDMTNMVRKVSSTVQNVNKGLTVGEVPNVSNALVTRAEVYGTNNVENNLVHTIGDELNIDGIKGFKKERRSMIPYDMTDYPSSGEVSYIISSVYDNNNRRIYFHQHLINSNNVFIDREHFYKYYYEEGILHTIRYRVSTVFGDANGYYKEIRSYLDDVQITAYRIWTVGTQ